MQKQNQEKIKKAWLKILETLLALKNIISETSTNQEEIPQCLILAQRLNNEFDYFEKEYGIPNDVVSKIDFQDRKNKRDVDYKELYKAFNKISNEDMVHYIENDLKDRVLKYKMFVSNLRIDSQKDIVKMLMLRNEIKMLLDELEIWMGKWGGDKTRDEWEHKNKIWQEVAGYDNVWKEFVRNNKRALDFLSDEREINMIMKPDGSDRFEFTWWYVN